MLDGLRNRGLTSPRITQNGTHGTLSPWYSSYFWICYQFPPPLKNKHNEQSTANAETSSVTWRKLQTPGTAEEHQRQETHTISPNDREPAQLTDQAQATFERAAQESRRITPTSTAAVHASNTATTRHHYPHPTGSPPDHLSQRSPLRSTGGLSRTTTPHTSAVTRSAKHVAAARDTGATAKWNDSLQRDKYSRTGTGACRFVRLRHETYGRAGPAAFALLNQIAPQAAESQRTHVALHRD